MDELDLFNEECLFVHNEFRRVHNVKQLTYDRELAIQAQKYASVIAENSTLRHSTLKERNYCGENLSQSKRAFMNYVYSGLAACVLWYSEINDYDFHVEEQVSGKLTEHFTQIIWKETENAGFGRVKNMDNNTWYIVGRYFPAGNIKHEYKRNITPIWNHLVRWEDITVVKEYLEELRTWEYTKARKHILDTYSMKITSTNDRKGFLVKENFKPQNGDPYHESQIFSNDVTNQSRPIYVSNQLARWRNSIPYSSSDSKGKIILKTSELSDNDDLTSEYGIEDFFNCNDDGFINSLLERQNLYRKRHGVNILTIDLELQSYARKWADILANGVFLGFSNYKFEDSVVGENIALKKDLLTNESAHRLVDNWYNEKKNYIDNSDQANIKSFGHFTQIVWKNTRKIGIGISTTSLGFHFIVCFYHPPGNIKDKFEEMVPMQI